MEASIEAYKIYYNPEFNCVMMDWEGYASSQEFREGTELMLNMLIKNNASTVIANIKDMAIIGLEDQQWMNSVFLPRAIKFGLKDVAIVKPDSYFNKVAVESISYKVDKEKLRINFFDDVEQAKAWLVK